MTRLAAPTLVALLAALDGALLGGVAAIITSLGGILAIVLSYRHGRRSVDGHDKLVQLRADLRVARAENRALRAERDAALSRR